MNFIEILTGIKAWTNNKLSGKYEKPSVGIPKSDLASSVQSSLNNADSAYQKPSTGIPATDMTESVRRCLELADSSATLNRYIIEGGHGLKFVASANSYLVRIESENEEFVYLISCGDDYTNTQVTALTYSIPTGVSFYLCHDTRLLIWASSACRISLISLKENGAIDSETIDEMPEDVEEIVPGRYATDLDLADKQDIISDLSAIRSGAAAGATAYQKPSGGIPKTDLESAVQTSLGKADTAATLIPAQASALNQLADKNFVNSSIQTETATFRGNYATWGNVPTEAEELPDGKADNNDYMVVRDASYYANMWYENRPCAYGNIVTDPSLLDLYICKNEEYTPEEPLISETAPSDDSTNWEPVTKNPRYEGTWRFKYVPSGSTYDKFNWQPEYQVNEKPLTAAQLAALNSGITSGKVSKLDALPTRAELTLEEQALDKVFVARYDTGGLFAPTTYTDIKAAYDNGKALVLELYYQGTLVGVLPLSSVAVNYFRFAQLDSTHDINRVSVSSSNAWAFTQSGLQARANLVTSFGSTPSNNKYPSEKLVYDSLYKRGVISQTQTWTRAADGGYDYVMSDLVYGNIPQANIDLFVAAGATFNATTGYFELNGLTDISYEEMQKIYNFGPLPYNAQYWLYNLNVIRTNLPTKRYSINTSWVARGATIEVFAFNPNAVCDLSDGTYPFYAALYTKEILGEINISAYGSGARPFELMSSLVSVQLKSLKGDMDFKSSPRLSLASVQYMVNNAANTSAITITLHATAYARAQADTTEYTYGGQTYTGIIAYATAKNITIASA